MLSHLIAAGLLALAFYACTQVLDNRLIITTLDVGQGDAILIQTPEHKNILIDAGPDATVVDRLGKHMGFFDKTIDFFVLTHPHADHFGGLPDILQKYQIKQALITGVAASDPLYTEAIRTLKTQHIPIIFAEGGTDWQIGHGTVLDVLYPLAGQSLLGAKADNLNNTSVAIRLISPDGKTALLTGDAEKEEEREILLASLEMQADILKAGHHGSRTATSDIFLQAVRPDTVVISAGKDNTFGHPHAETLDRLKGLDVRQTVLEGDIVLW